MSPGNDLLTCRALAATGQLRREAPFTQQRLGQLQRQRPFANSRRSYKQERTGQATRREPATKTIHNFVMSFDALPGHVG